MREHNSYSCILELKDEDPEVLEDCTSMDFKTRRSTRMALKIWRSIYWFEKLPKSNFWYRCIKKQRYWISQRVTKNSKQKVKSNQRTSKKIAWHPISKVMMVQTEIKKDWKSIWIYVYDYKNMKLLCVSRF